METKAKQLEELANKMAEEKAKIERTVYYDDFLAAFKSLMEFVNKSKLALKEQADEQGGKINTKLTETLKTIETKASELDTIHNKAVQNLKSDQRTFQRMIDEKLSFFEESLPEDYDDTELRESLTELRKVFDGLEIPEEFDATELTQQVDKNTEDIEDLKKRPVGKGGGVTNARIQQAFKYILKTEEPVGDIDGANDTYTLSQPIFAILSMSINGEVIAELPNYTISGKTFTFGTALPAVYSGKDFEVKYI